MTRPVIAALAAATLLALAPPFARADAQKTRTRSEATVRMLAPLVIGDYDSLKVRCHRHAPQGTWKCRVRWTTRSRQPALFWGGRVETTRTVCTNPAFWNRPSEVEMDDAQTRCRVTTAAASRSGF